MVLVLEIIVFLSEKNIVTITTRFPCSHDRHDPNWGRIAAAAGYSGIAYSQNAVKILLGDTMLMDKGQPLPFDEAKASSYLKGKAAEHGTVRIEVSVGDGKGKGVAWGCDLSYDYVKINAEYTT